MPHPQDLWHAPLNAHLQADLLHPSQLERSLQRQGMDMLRHVKDGKDAPTSVPATPSCASPEAAAQLGTAAFCHMSCSARCGDPLVHVDDSAPTRMFRCATGGIRSCALETLDTSTITTCANLCVGPLPRHARQSQEDPGNHTETLDHSIPRPCCGLGRQHRCFFKTDHPPASSDRSLLLLVHPAAAIARSDCFDHFCLGAICHSS